MKSHFGPTTDDKTPAPHAGLWHRVRPALGDGRTPMVFWSMVLALGVIALLGVTWGASSLLSRSGSEKLLRVDLLFPKLKNNHGDRKATAFRMSEPEVSESAHPKDWKTPQPAPLPAVVLDHPRVTIIDAPVHAEPPRVSPAELPPLPPPAAPACNEPVIYLKACTFERGDSPMKRTWKSLTMISLLSAAAVTLAPPPVVLAQDGKDVDLGKLEKSLLDSLKAEFKKLESGALAELGRNVRGVGKDVKDLKKELETLETAVGTLQTNQLNQKILIENQKKELDLLADEVRTLRKRLLTDATASTMDKAAAEEMIRTMRAMQDAIAKFGPTEKRTMLSPPTNGATPTTGRVILQNLYNEDLLFIINGANYRVLPGTSRVIENVPLGPVTYVVHSSRWGPLANRTTTLTNSENTFNLTAAHPR